MRKNASIHLICLTYPGFTGWLRNQKPEPSEPSFPKPKAEPEPPESFRNRSQNRPLLLTCTETQKTLLQRNRQNREPEPLKPFRNPTEPNRGHPAFIALRTFKGPKTLRHGVLAIESTLVARLFVIWSCDKRKETRRRRPMSGNKMSAIIVGYQRRTHQICF